MLDKHYVLYDDIIRIPLVAKIPGAKPRVSHEFVMNCLDIPASIRKWAGLAGEPMRHGRPLPETAEEEPGAPGAEQKARERERRRQEAILAIQRRYGSNAILKGMNLEEGATTRERNKQIGGHRA